MQPTQSTKLQQISISNANKCSQLPLPRTINFNIQITIANELNVSFLLFHEGFPSQRDRRDGSVRFNKFCWSSAEKSEQWNVVNRWWWKFYKTGTVVEAASWEDEKLIDFKDFSSFNSTSTDKRIVQSADWNFSFAAFLRLNVTANRHDRREKPHKHFNHSMWNSLPYQFTIVDGVVWEETEAKWE